MTKTEDEKVIFKNWKQFQLNEVKLILWHSFTDITMIPYYSSFTKNNYECYYYRGDFLQ
jgi:hypothetical protein